MSPNSSALDVPNTPPCSTRTTYRYRRRCRRDASPESARRSADARPHGGRLTPLVRQVARDHAWAASSTKVTHRARAVLGTPAEGLEHDLLGGQVVGQVPVPRIALAARPGRGRRRRRPSRPRAGVNGRDEHGRRRRQHVRRVGWPSLAPVRPRDSVAVPDQRRRGPRRARGRGRVRIGRPRSRAIRVPCPIRCTATCRVVGIVECRGSTTSRSGRTYRRATSHRRRSPDASARRPLDRSASHRRDLGLGVEVPAGAPHRVAEGRVDVAQPLLAGTRRRSRRGRRRSRSAARKPSRDAAFSMLAMAWCRTPNRWPNTRSGTRGSTIVGHVDDVGLDPRRPRPRVATYRDRRSTTVAGDVEDLAHRGRAAAIATDQPAQARRRARTSAATSPPCGSDDRPVLEEPQEHRRLHVEDVVRPVRRSPPAARRPPGNPSRRGARASPARRPP